MALGQGSSSLLLSAVEGVCCECVRLIIDCHNRWQGPWVRSAGWDCCTLHYPVQYWWNNGNLSLNVV